MCGRAGIRHCGAYHSRMLKMLQFANRPRSHVIVGVVALTSDVLFLHITKEKRTPRLLLWSSNNCTDDGCVEFRIMFSKHFTRYSRHSLPFFVFKHLHTQNNKRTCFSPVDCTFFYRLTVKIKDCYKMVLYQANGNPSFICRISNSYFFS